MALHIFRLLTLGLLAPALSMGTAQAEEWFWTYGDWTVHVDAFDTGEDWRTTCAAWTGGDGDPTLRLETSNGDAGPPDDYPRVTLHESAPRGYNTQMQNGQAITLIIDQELDYYALVDAYYDEDGIVQAEAQVRWQDAAYILLSMKSGSQMDMRLMSPIKVSERIYLASLSGFTAAYGKMMDSCGHPIDVEEPALH